MTEANTSASKTILYVDDEEKSLKYFQLNFKTEYTIYTATSVDEGLAILTERGPEIDILVSDQRMPEKSGTELLRETRLQYPNIIRILTTAYTDLKSAIDAVNDGAIFQYVCKPWDFDSFAGVLKQASDFHTIRTQRDQLLGQKVNVWQRLLLTDRVQSLMVAAQVLDVLLPNAVSAVAHYVSWMPPVLKEKSVVQVNPMKLMNFQAMAKGESDDVAFITDHLIEVLSLKTAPSFESKPASVVLPMVNSQASLSVCQPQLEAVVTQLYGKLMAWGLAVTPVVEESDYNGVPALSIQFDLPISEEQLGEFYEPLYLADAKEYNTTLLAFTLTVFGHGGLVALEGQSGAYLAKVYLPIDGGTLAVPSRPHAIELLQRHFDSWSVM